MAATVTLKPGHIAQLPIGQLAPDPDQPRTSIDEAALQALADNIKARGVLQPILVRAGEKGLVIVDGERRWRAAKLARLKAVPAMLHVAGTTEVELRVDQVAANNLRQALSPMDFARFLRRLRDDQKLPASGIAAALEQHGMKALTKQEIETQLLLTDLPDWAQDMVDAKTLDLAAAPAIRRAAQDPEIGKAVRKSLEQKVDWSGRVTASEARETLRNVMRNTYVDLDRISSWNSEPVHFAHKTRCKGCEHYTTGDGFAVCRSKKLFAEHQAEAKAAGLGPGGSPPKRETKATVAKVEKQKAEQRERSIESTAREYLLRYILTALDQPIETDYQLALSLVLWAAARYPGAYGDGRTPPRIREMFGHDRADAVEQRWEGLPQMLRAPADLSDSRRPDDVRLVARQVKDTCDLEHMIILARHVWGEDLASFWRMDEAFPKLFRKAEIAHQLKACGAQLPEGRRSWDAMKTAELQAQLLANAERVGVPQILRDLYEQEIIPVRRAGRDPAAAPDAPVCIGCGCWEYDACDEGCTWLVTDGNRGVCDSPHCKTDHLPRWQSGDRSFSPAAQERREERGDLDDEAEGEDLDSDDDADDMDAAA